MKYMTSKFVDLADWSIPPATARDESSTEPTPAEPSNVIAEACRRLGRSEVETLRFVDIGKMEWLTDAKSFSVLKESDWNKLSFPIALKAEIKSHLPGFQAEPANRLDENVTKAAEPAAAVTRSIYHDKNVLNNVRNSRNVESKIWGGVSMPRAKGTKEEFTGISLVREELKKRGALGIVGIARQFRLVDSNGSGTIDLEEFRTAMKTINIADEDGSIFAEFDKDGSGTINYEEFLRSSRGGMNRKRILAVGDVFKTLDRDNDGFVTIEELQRHFLPENHAPVKEGKMTALQAKSEFLKLSDMDGDGKINKEEWKMYYEHVSQSIDDDTYFISMIRNSWKLPGTDTAMAHQFASQNLKSQMSHLA